LKRHEDVSCQVTVECAAVARAASRQASLFCAGSPQLTTMRRRLVENSKERQPACAWRLKIPGGGAPVSAITTLPPPSSR